MYLQYFFLSPNIMNTIKMFNEKPNIFWLLFTTPTDFL